MTEWIKSVVASGLGLAACSLIFALLYLGIILVFKRIERENFKLERTLNIGGPNRNRFRDPKKNRIK